MFCDSCIVYSEVYCSGLKKALSVQYIVIDNMIVVLLTVILTISKYLALHDSLAGLHEVHVASQCVYFSIVGQNPVERIHN